MILINDSYLENIVPVIKIFQKSNEEVSLHESLQKQN